MQGETVICHQCVGEKYVKSVIKAQGTAAVPCSYCERKRKNIPIYEVADLMHQVFNNYYIPENAYYYNERDVGDSASDVIQNELGVEENVADDIYQELCEQHNPRYPDDGLVYDEEFVYGRRQFSSQRVNQAWENMKTSLNSETRYFNQSVKFFLDDLFSDLDKFRTDQSETPIKTIDADFRLYRARYFESLHSVERELRHPERNFGPPPSALARSGRMNAHGIAVFYGATTPEIAIAEIRPPVGAHVIVAPFSPRKSLRILDLSALDALIFSQESVFNPETIKSLENTAFLKTFSHKLTLPVFDNQDKGYLITQVIAEYLSVSKEYNLDGISFRSTQVKKDSSVSRRRVSKKNGYNVVLFNKSSGVMYSGRNERAYKVSLMENLDDDRDFFNPTIQLVEASPVSQHVWSHSSFMNNSKTLELIVSELKYYKIDGVLFQKSMKNITQGESVKRRTESQPPEEIDPF
ncbi:RES domain-containing protein [Enterobacter cloacae complex sp. ECC445]|uniref:RES domain-containing protein n=1 Tax=Enterobacter cloacae complex sp. ECC445 TaxID=2913213 RepID=UPI001F3DEF98|nr:RES domain-containing protein [Enterobacter cloacae complex sp. ECC445]MCG0456686.1 RES domain-containing protein [Enterobacter cloacae complex sp. ECC445]